MKTAAKSRKTNREQARVPALVPAEAIVQHIIFLRGCKVLLDADLAVLYGVPTKVLLQAVKRNLERFPADFMFQLSAAEFAAMRSQIVTSNAGSGGRRCTLRIHRAGSSDAVIGAP